MLQKRMASVGTSQQTRLRHQSLVEAQQATRQILEPLTVGSSNIESFYLDLWASELVQRLLLVVTALRLL